ncbi:U5-snRNA binding site 2 of PrP8-domain-containing protein [Pisolithus thermaeus]|nr:U5-snRNA binding site 2 of PrP8-domain-containing protein [Pisolithus croceorrhizus]KAI6161370.1 U5-snRNA binding site 2 of PrP8-domain-containing protein [Pisolithus thermaeus]
MWLIKHGINPRRAWHSGVSLTMIEWEDTFISIYSRENGGFEVQILPNIRMLGGEQFSLKDAVWNFTNEQTKECIMTTQAFLHMSDDNEGSLALMSPGSTASSRIVNKWNTALICLIMYYHEVVIHVNKLLDALTHVKISLNSKMPLHFLPVIFYTLKELGSLSMLSMGHVLIPQSDLRWAKQTDVGVTCFQAAEFLDSAHVWSEYSIKWEEASTQSHCLTLEDLEDGWDQGIPHINTCSRRITRCNLTYDHSWPIHTNGKQYQLLRQWVGQDRKLWQFNNY